MACLEMYNSNGGVPISPRISFSNDFADISPQKNNSTRTKASSSPSSDFEFSVTNNAMMTADELFFKGKLLPFKQTNHVQRTLREELLIEEEGSEGHGFFTLKPPPSSSSSSSKGRWKGLLGFKRDHVGSKKAHKISEGRFVHPDNKQSQEGEYSTWNGTDGDMQ
ncbi:PREDICTED: uncharacterized protein LOC104819222 [Tarenaya hassleriana]|uniref:uncharacterized protein LOC104819222 n=1 Tax=Tarenaya hassleriana TaxID=28532 RepID=UPI00053C0888|nr:PREDICTED: uncharacterized protein LOC104819222 [Tarenaya hassleriana]